LPDREKVVSTAGFGGVTRARKGALRVVNLRAVDGLATVAFAIVLKTSVAVTVAFSTKPVSTGT
jgi:hypothetical protein